MTARLRVRCHPGGSSLELTLPAEDGTAGEAPIKVEPQTLIWRATLPDGAQAILKLYRWRRFFEVRPLRIGPQRVRREYEALAHLHAHGVPCTEPLFWAEGRARATGGFELLATREIPGAVPLRDWIGTAPPAARDEALRASFRLVRAMHASGVSHGSLSFKNLLVVAGASGPDVVLVDLARAVVFARDLAGSRAAYFDLTDLARKVIETLDGEVARTCLEAYGLAPDGAEELVRFAQDHRPRRHRQRRFLEARLRRRLGAIDRESMRVGPEALPSGPERTGYIASE